MASGPEEWVPGELDERIIELFGRDPWSAVAELTAAVLVDVSLEGQLVDLIQASLDTAADDTLGTAAAILVLGEIRSREAIGPLLLALDADDEVVVAAAVRALGRIGEPALEPLTDLLDSPDLDEDVAQAVVDALEGMREQSDLRMPIETRLLRELLAPGIRPRRRESAALALARIGVPRAGPVIEKLLHDEFAAGNAFLQEALEIIEEHPEGIPSPAELPWQSDLRWADGSVLPGGEIEAESEDEEDLGGGRRN